MGDGADALLDQYALDAEESKARRARNRENSAAILRQHDVGFAERNNGAHLIVRATVDFWPGTGKWKDRGKGVEGRGVFNLLRHLGVRTPAKER